MKTIAALVLAAAFAHAQTLLVLNKTDATLAIVDPQSNQILECVPTGEGRKIRVCRNYGGRLRGIRFP